jgi:hypothetical protein
MKPPPGGFSIGGNMRKTAAVKADPTIPRTPITLNGKTYDLCFKMRALGEAELAINAELIKAKREDRVNLLYALPGDSLLNLQILFAAALRTHHSEISFDEAVDLVTYHNVYEVRRVVREAWEAVAAKPEPGNPPEPGK